MGNLSELVLREWAHTLLLASCLLVLTSQLVPPAYALSNDGPRSQVHDQPTSITLSGTERSREGYFQLQVKGLNDDQSFVIEQSSSSAFDSIDATFPPLGAFRQVSLSGFDDGRYYFRARVQDADGGHVFSSTHQLTVQHYPLWQALGLFGLGALLFLALVITLLGLHWRSNQISPPKSSENAHG